MSKKALVTGIAGQDGAYLAQLLLEKGYKVYGADRDSSPAYLWRLNYLHILDQIHIELLDITDTASVYDAVGRHRPDEVYHLAALTVPGLSNARPINYAQVNGTAVINLLEAVRCIDPHIKLFMASTVKLLEKNACFSAMDGCRFEPDDPYAIAKLYGYAISNIYREGYGMYVATGIMSNHESCLRPLDFVTRKISNEVARISLGLSKRLELGRIEVMHDWGYAPDFVKAMWLMLQQDKPHDYILATNEYHTVKEFVEKAFALVGLDWKKYVKADLAVAGDNGSRYDSSETQAALGWRPEVKFDEIVKIMVEEDVHRWKRHIKGENFPWDINSV
jgi:GDPmannose 4,6-dehydratase